MEPGLTWLSQCTFLASSDCRGRVQRGRSMLSGGRSSAGGTPGRGWAGHRSGAGAGGGKPGWQGVVVRCSSGTQHQHAAGSAFEAACPEEQPVAIAPHQLVLIDQRQVPAGTARAGLAVEPAGGPLAALGTQTGRSPPSMHKQGCPGAGPHCLPAVDVLRLPRLASPPSTPFASRQPAARSRQLLGAPLSLTCA